MVEPMADALDELQRRVGPVDQYVADQLGYKVEEVRNGEYWGAEQVDALGLALDNLERGKGFIIGDQTGIGKGRVNAAIIMWAIKRGRIPVFVTMTPALYADMFRDLKAIGAFEHGLGGRMPRILPTNANKNLPLEEGGLSIETAMPADHNKHLLSLNDANFRKKYDMVFTTYDQMNTLKGEDTARRSFLLGLAGDKEDGGTGVVMIFDESHNAGGQKKQRKEKNAPMDRAEFARDLVQKANGVFYSSATYAKRPEVMDLYSATNMSMAVDNISQLAEAISKGGIPMQQAVAAMLAKDGQYMRRERSFAGINYNTKTVPVDRKTYNDVASGMYAIHELSAFVKAAARNMTAQIRADGEAFGHDAATGDAGARSTAFTSVMHNVVNQMLLAMKADQAADHAIALIKAGEKPIFTVANTMEKFMKDYTDNIDVADASVPGGFRKIKPGDVLPGDFSEVLIKYLNRTRTVLIKKPFKEKGEKPIRHYLTDDELGPAGVAVYERAESIIRSLNLTGLPISPIDYIKGRLKKAGYDTGEITGRTLAVDYTGKEPIFATREGSERTTKGKVKTVRRFNTRPNKGGLHAAIINQSGSTGISMHSSVDFDDQSKRHMIIVQPEANIDTHMQLLGRPNRTGQVVLPEYTQMQADIPAEIRPASVLAKKMASLNANTTASRDSAVTSKEAIDFLNEYGDQIAAQWVSDNPEMHTRIGSPVSVSESGVPEKVDAMRALTGRIPLLPLADQEALYNELTEAYKALIEQLEAAGENALEAKSLDLKAKLLEKTEVQGRRNDSGSQFAAPVYIQKVSIARQGKPFTPLEVINRVMQALNGPQYEGKDENPTMLANLLKGLNDPYSLLGKQVQAKESDERNAAVKAFNDYMRPIVDDEETPEARTKKMGQLNAIKDRWTEMHAMLPIGKRVVFKTANGNLTGIVINVKQEGEPKNPLALGTWRVTAAIADATRQIKFPFSQLYPTGKANPESVIDVEVEPMTDWYERPEATLDRFQHMQTEAREERYIAGGNMLAAYDWLGNKGAIINYTGDKGTVHRGILTGRDFDLVKQSVAKGRTAQSPQEVKKYLDDNPRAKILSRDTFLELQRTSHYAENYKITANKSKRKGGVYFLDQKLTDITGDFRTESGAMVVNVPPEKLLRAIARMQELGAEFKMAADLAKPETGGPDFGLAERDAPLTRSERAELDELDNRRDDLDDWERDRLDELESVAASPLPEPARSPQGRGAEGQAYVLEHGRMTESEFLIAYDAAGNEVDRHTSGMRNFVNITPKLKDALLDPASSIVLHHNQSEEQQSKPAGHCHAGGTGDARRMGALPRWRRLPWRTDAGIQGVDVWHQRCPVQPPDRSD